MEIVIVMNNKFLLFLSCCLFLGSCKKDEKPITQNGEDYTYVTDYSPENIPYATQTELDKFSKYIEIIDYKIARYYAYAEIENALWIPLKTTQGAYQLTERPVIVYDYDSKPKFYEFGVVENGLLIGTVTTIAKKEATDFVSYIFNYPLSYSDKGSYDYIVGAYPANFLGNVSSPGSSPSLVVSPYKNIALKAGSANTYLNYAGFVKEMDSESQVDYVEGLANLAKEMVEMKEGLLEFWIDVEKDKNRILSLNDSAIIAEVQDGIFGKTEDYARWDERIINNSSRTFGSENMKKTRWSGWCGPSVLAWIYRGMYTSYPRYTANYLRIHGDGSTSNNVFRDNLGYGDRGYYYYLEDAIAGNNSVATDYGLYKKLWSYCTKTGSSYPMYQSGMNKAMKAVTNNTYGVNMTLYPHDRIRINGLPVLTMIGFGGQLHYLVAFGSAYGKNKNGKIKGKFLLVTDNGAAIKRHNYYPYWRNQSPDPGIRYKVYYR